MKAPCLLHSHGLVEFHSCVSILLLPFFRDRGQLVCFGANGRGQAGFPARPEGVAYGANIGDAAGEIAGLETTVPLPGRVLQVSAGAMATCVVLEFAADADAAARGGGNVRCFGAGVVAAPPFNASAVSVGLLRTCVVAIKARQKIRRHT